MLRYIIEIILVFAGIVANAAFFWYTWNEKDKGETENALAVESWRHASYTYELAWTIQERLLHFDELSRNDQEKVFAIIEELKKKAEAKEKEKNSAKEEDLSVDGIFWTRAEKLYGQKRNALRWLDHTVPVKNMATGYGYITVVDAAMHTGCNTNLIQFSCDRIEGGYDEEKQRFRYITREEYAKMPEDHVEVTTRKKNKYADIFLIE